MATVSQHAANIVALAEQADSLVSQFRALMASIEAEEQALHREAITNGPFVQDAIAGRRRLGSYAHALILQPEGSTPTVTELATSAWSAVTDI